MKFRAHDTFFIRKGWLTKGMKNMLIDPTVFVNKTNNPMDTLGIGANMVKSLRYWLQAVGLTQEPNSGQRLQTFTPFGQVIYENDKYIEEPGTLWLLHYKLASNFEDATSWYYFFNEFKLNEFTRDDFISHISSFLKEKEPEKIHSLKTLEDDYNCIINTYLPRFKSNPEKVNPESNIDCPLGELGLIDIANKKSKLYRKSQPKIDTVHPLIALAIIIDNLAEQKSKEIKISDLQNNINNIGKIFNLDIITLTSLLYKLENSEYIKVIRTAGLDVIRLTTELDFIGCVKEYYFSING
ncbi:MAG: DUF4007 family protein [Oscillospiraceae bacterium]|jgi:hypothetical protein|nr:DUF4007 family protein [Oscillospiraceae bacterium]